MQILKNDFVLNLPVLVTHTTMRAKLQNVVLDYQWWWSFISIKSNYIANRIQIVLKISKKKTSNKLPKSVMGSNTSWYYGHISWPLLCFFFFFFKRTCRVCVCDKQTMSFIFRNGYSSFYAISSLLLNLINAIYDQWVKCYKNKSHSTYLILYYALGLIRIG